MCVWCLELSKITTVKIHDTPAGDELCTAYTDWTLIASCSGIKDHIHLLPLYLWHPFVLLETRDLLFVKRTFHPFMSSFNHVIYCLETRHSIYWCPLLTTWFIVCKEEIPSIDVPFEPRDLFFVIRTSNPQVPAFDHIVYCFNIISNPYVPPFIKVIYC